MHEFELIRRFFQRPEAPEGPGVVLGIGDDCALLQPAQGQQLALSVDTLVADVHFPADADPAEIAQRALRVNLSDLAAMGASPRWFTLALTLPEADEHWLRAFGAGLFVAADAYGCTLVGGDTTAGPLSITVQVMGEVAPARALRRDGAGIGDYVLVTHCLGDGAGGLAAVRGELDLPEAELAYLRARYYRPEPRLAEAQRLLGLASAALDISDGLVADLGHICAASDVAAQIDVETLPLSPALLALDDRARVRDWALTGGDDYELCFTVPEARMPEVGLMIARGELNATVVGQLVTGTGVHCLLDGEPYTLEDTGYKHF